MILSNSVNPCFYRRIEWFCGFKNIEVVSVVSSITKSQSIETLREIEEKHPYPIGFVGPCEGKIVWASDMVMGDFIDFEEIMEVVEDEYFIMGPTFSVADCILAADLTELRLNSKILFPEGIINYIKRVELICGTKNAV